MAVLSSHHRGNKSGAVGVNKTSLVPLLVRGGWIPRYLHMKVAARLGAHQV